MFSCMTVGIAAFVFSSCIFRKYDHVGTNPSNPPAAPNQQNSWVRNENSEVRAMWLSFPFWNMSRENKQKFVSYIAAKGVNKVFLSVYDSGIARWKSSVLAKAGAAISDGDAPLIEAVNMFRTAGIEVSAFFEGGLSVMLDKDLYKKHPDMMQKCPNGGTASGEHGGHLYAFLDPSNANARKLLLGAFEELAKHSVQFQEIELDRFRYTHWDWKMCTASNGTSNPEYVNSLVREIYQKIKSVRSEILVTAAPVGSYGYWKHNQRWGQWVAGGYIDGIETQAYIPHEKLEECKRGTAQTQERKITLAIFKGELASVIGDSVRLNAALAELRALGADADSVMEVKNRIPMVQTRQKELEHVSHPFRLSIGYDAHRFDDSECVQEQVAYARSIGFKNGVLWLSAVEPDAQGNPNPAVDDNLSYLANTFWKF